MLYEMNKTVLLEFGLLDINSALLETTNKYRALIKLTNKNTMLCLQYGTNQ